MISEIDNLMLLPLGFPQVFKSLLIALACGLAISFLYRHTYRGVNYSVTFANALVALAMITAIVILLIGNNLARAFGLVGAMSIIRFRTAVKDTQDIVLIFFALAVGMAAGIGMVVVALTGTVFIGVVIFALSRLSRGSVGRQEYLLQFLFAINGETEAPYLPVLEAYCKKDKLINVKSLNDGNVLELSYYVHLKADDKSGAFIRSLSAIQGVEQVNLYFDEEQV